MADEEAANKYVAGSNAIICRPCVETCSDLFAESDPTWRDAQIARLQAIRKRSG